MRLLRVTATRRAQAQFERATRWRLEKRVDPAPLKVELQEAVRLLLEQPELGPVTPGRPGVRRYLLPRASVFVYYRVDHERGVLTIVAFWHTSRGSGPPL